MKKYYLVFLVVFSVFISYFLIQYEAVELSEVPVQENCSFPLFGGVYFDGVKLVPYSSPDFKPPLIIRGEVTKRRPYRTIFSFFNQNGSLMGNYTMKAAFHAGYFYFKNGFIIYTVSTDGFDVNAFTYDLKYRYWVMVHPIYLNYHVIIPMGAFADEAYAYFFTANEDDVRERVANYCLTYIEFESGDVGRVCSSALKAQPLGARVFANRIYVAVKGSVLLFKHGKLVKKVRMSLNDKVLMQANADYLALAYDSKTCVFTSTLKAHECFNAGEEVENLKLEDNKLHLKTKNKTQTLKITTKT